MEIGFRILSAQDAVPIDIDLDGDGDGDLDITGLGVFQNGTGMCWVENFGGLQFADSLEVFAGAGPNFQRSRLARVSSGAVPDLILGAGGMSVGAGQEAQQSAARQR